MKIANAVVVITGAANGIGYALAKRFKPRAPAQLRWPILTRIRLQQYPKKSARWDLPAMYRESKTFNVWCVKRKWRWAQSTYSAPMPA